MSVFSTWLAIRSTHERLMNWINLAGNLGVVQK